MRGLSSLLRPGDRSLSWWIAAGLAVALPAGGVAQRAPEVFRDGDRWCAIGDEMTETGFYHQWIALYYLTRFPERDIAVLNAGVYGDTAGGAWPRLKWDVLARSSTVVSVMFGINDIGRDLYDQADPAPDLLQERRARIESFQADTRALVGALRDAGVRPILIAPPIYDETAQLPSPVRAGTDAALAECAAFLETLARESGAAFVNFRGPMARINREGQAVEPMFTVIGQDRVHPGSAGHFLMAALFLAAQGAPAAVAGVEIDLGTGVVRAANGTVENVRKQADGGVAFRWKENALPYPVPEEAAPALDWTSFHRDLNQEILQVTGLPQGAYTLFIDGKTAARKTADELARGVNLATVAATPQFEQAMTVARLLEAHARLVADNLRTVAQVEHEAAPDIEHPVTMLQMAPALERRLEFFQQYRPPGAVWRSYQLYPQRKEREEESAAQAARLWRLAREAARPVPHDYAIARVK